MIDGEADAWLVLHHAPGLTARAALALVEEAGTAAGALQRLRRSPPRILPTRTRSWLDAEAPGLCARARDWARSSACSLLVYSDPRYPVLLRQLADPPLALYVAGDTRALTGRQVAVIGSRRPSGAGPRIAAGLACALVRAGLAITGGLAVGIDAGAHRGALGAGGATIAVLGSGLQRIYPRAHAALAGEIVAGSGALVSELPLGAPPLSGHFPRRNRLISGLALGVVVVEASLRSGSLITARHALDQGRELFAVPGSIHNPVARGCHRLLRQGAGLVESAADVLAGLGLPAAAPLSADAARGDGELPASMRRFLDRLGFGPVAPETLVCAGDLTAAEVSSMLIDLEIRGYVCSQSDGNYCRLR